MNTQQRKFRSLIEGEEAVETDNKVTFKDEKLGKIHFLTRKEYHKTIIGCGVLHQVIMSGNLYIIWTN